MRWSMHAQPAVHFIPFPRYGDSMVTLAVAHPEMSVFGVFFVLFVVAGTIAWHFRRSRQILDRWADRNGYEILEAEYRHFFKGPFFWRSSKDQTVYRVTVRDKTGIHKGWVRCGGWWFGIMTDKAEARWDDPLPERKVMAGSHRDVMSDRWLDH
ncbi:hypothetical protein [Aquisphaera insulae]|uniref:hypothetical protein n=1 Tax=Aquisphaera insulae TaxID=2712864 RepID=UPI0013EC3BFC|nr:hypothetical protein [Aquisphaera insulae]